MAKLDARRSENVDGEFFVDTSCIDCDTCRWMAPGTFDRAGSMSRVYAQPATEIERRDALRALISCPTASIGTSRKASDLSEVARSFPVEITDTVRHCGYHSEASFGAASYLLLRDEGNVLIDSPRWSTQLAQGIEALGGARWMFLTHIDDVADHERWAARFGLERIMHRGDARGDLPSKIEHWVEGEEPVTFDGDLRLIPVPGHTRGSICLLHEGRLFTGDHLCWSEAESRLHAFHRACWYDWEQQVESMKRLVEFEFEWVLPGHGHRILLEAGTTRSRIEEVVNWMMES